MTEPYRGWRWYGMYAFSWVAGHVVWLARWPRDRRLMHRSEIAETAREQAGRAEVG